MAARVFLGLSALIWLPYGIWCLLDPAQLAGSAGVSFVSATGSTELRAMYGGLQAGIGALALGGVLRASLERPALLMLLFLTAGLASARLVGLALDGSASSYTLTALCFEIPTAAITGWLLARAPLERAR
jgi:hypothetical protein